jgi:Domain of unknown function (DUF4333)
MHIEPTTPSTARVRRGPRGAIVAIGALALAALISACGSSSSKEAPGKPVDTSRVALSIKDTIREKRHLTSTVACPAAVTAAKGKTFVCTATVRSAKKPYTYKKTPFTVTVQNDRGYVTYVGE